MMGKTKFNRRDFLKGIGVASVALVAAKIPSLKRDVDVIKLLSALKPNRIIIETGDGVTLEMKPIMFSIDVSSNLPRIKVGSNVVESPLSISGNFTASQITATLKGKRNA